MTTGIEKETKPQTKPLSQKEKDAVNCLSKKIEKPTDYLLRLGREFDHPFIKLSARIIQKASQSNDFFEEDFFSESKQQQSKEKIEALKIPDFALKDKAKIKNELNSAIGQWSSLHQKTIDASTLLSAKKDLIKEVVVFIDHLKQGDSSVESLVKAVEKYNKVFIA